MIARAVALLLAFAVAASAQDAALVPRGSTWRYLVGVEEPSADWTRVDFDDAAWLQGPASLGYGDDDDATTLADLHGRATTLYLRHAFDVADPAATPELVLSVRYDDGFVAWLNGHEIARAGVEGEHPPHDAVAKDHEAKRFENWPVPGILLRAGRNVLAIQAIDASLQSSDFSIDAEVTQAISAATSVAPQRPSAGDSIPLPAHGLPASTSAADGPRVRWATTFAFRGSDNYFQGVAGSPATEVLGQVLREEALVALKTPRPADLVLGVEQQRVGHLGDQTSAWARASFALPHAQRLSADVASQWGRPAYVVGDELGTTDSLAGALEWSMELRQRERVTTWGSWRSDSTELDPRRSTHETEAGVSYRWLRPRKASPEIGLEQSNRTAADENFEARQVRALFKLTSSLGRRTWLSLLLRHGWRDYTTDDPLLSNHGRSDRRYLARITTSIRATDAWRVGATLSWERGTSSGEDAAFDAREAWLGLTWTSGSRKVAAPGPPP